MFHTVAMTCNLYSMQMIFKSAPWLEIMQVTFLRGVIVLCMMLLYLNCNLKSKVVDPINCSNLPFVVARVISGGICLYIGFVAINVFAVSTVGVVMCLKPALAMILGIFVLNEPKDAKDFITTAAIIGSVLLVICG